MNKSNIILKLILLSLCGCAIGKHGVYLKEMQKAPILQLHDNVLTVNTFNSIENSSLLIYRVNVSIDNTSKIIYLFADQRAGKKFQDAFTIHLKDHKLDTSLVYSFYWHDPDKKAHKLELRNE